MPLACTTEESTPVAAGKSINPQTRARYAYRSAGNHPVAGTSRRESPNAPVQSELPRRTTQSERQSLNDGAQTGPSSVARGLAAVGRRVRTSVAGIRLAANTCSAAGATVARRTAGTTEARRTTGAWRTAGTTRTAPARAATTCRATSTRTCGTTRTDDDVVVTACDVEGAAHRRDHQHHRTKGRTVRHNTCVYYQPKARDGQRNLQQRTAYRGMPRSITSFRNRKAGNERGSRLVWSAGFFTGETHLELECFETMLVRNQLRAFGWSHPVYVPNGSGSSVPDVASSFAAAHCRCRRIRDSFPRVMRVLRIFQGSTGPSGVSRALV
jgi:hypothetical protein